jgi:hypothetical protein
MAIRIAAESNGSVAGTLIKAVLADNATGYRVGDLVEWTSTTAQPAQTGSSQPVATAVIGILMAFEPNGNPNIKYPTTGVYIVGSGGYTSGSLIGVIQPIQGDAIYEGDIYSTAPTVGGTFTTTYSSGSTISNSSVGSGTVLGRCIELVGTTKARVKFYNSVG